MLQILRVLIIVIAAFDIAGLVPAARSLHAVL
jgi:hypothetical protein